MICHSKRSNVSQKNNFLITLSILLVDLMANTVDSQSSQLRSGRLELLVVPYRRQVAIICFLELLMLIKTLPSYDD